MGPPLKSWRHPIRVFRHGTVCCTEMMTQIVPKAPKWTFGQLRRQCDEERAAALSPGPLLAAIPKSTYTREPVYSFPHATSIMPRVRPASSPPGPTYVPRTKPTTPRYSFGSTKRPCPFQGEGGPGPRAVPHPEDVAAPKYSIGARRGTKETTSPGPGQYRPRIRDNVRVPAWGKGGDSPPVRLQSATPGPYHFELGMGGKHGPSYTMTPRREEKVDDTRRRLAPQYTYFGYNDFGHSECDCPQP